MLSQPSDFSEHAGIDVSAEELTLRVARTNGQSYDREFDNDPGGIDALLDYLTGTGNRVRVCLESTGRYGLDLALALAACEQIEVISPDPARARRYAQSLDGRGKTDELDAEALMRYDQERRHPVWQAPAEDVVELRDTTRRLQQIKRDLQRAENRLHALEASNAYDPEVKASLERQIERLETEQERMEDHRDELVAGSERLSEECDLLQTVTGIGPVHVTELVAELGVLDRDMNRSEITALAGLDPVPIESGSSIREPRHISKRGNARIRSALFRAALSALEYDPAARRFFLHLTERKGKPGKVAVVALARRMLTAVWSMLKNGNEWDPERFCPNIEPVETA